MSLQLKFIYRINILNEENLFTDPLRRVNVLRLKVQTVNSIKVVSR